MKLLNELNISMNLWIENRNIGYKWTRTEFCYILASADISIYNYFKKLLFESENTEDIILDRFHCLTTNDKLNNKPINGKDSYFIVYERPLQDQNPIKTSVKLIPCPVNCETLPVKENSHLIIGFPPFSSIFWRRNFFINVNLQNT